MRIKVLNLIGYVPFYKDMDATQIIPSRDRRTRDTNRLQQLLPTYHSKLELVTDASTVMEFRAAIGCHFSDPKCSFKGACLNCLKFTDCLNFQLHFQNCIYKKSFMKSVDKKIILINIYDL